MKIILKYFAVPIIVLSFVVISVLLGLAIFNMGDDTSDESSQQESTETTTLTEVEVPDGLEVATFGTGCFWCMEAAFQETEGVISAISGYAGGSEVNPTYEQVYKLQTSHLESVQVFYDPMIISFEGILDVFWRGIDPTDNGGQFVDRRFSYTTAVFYHDDSQRQLTEASIQNLVDSSIYENPVVTPVIMFSNFYEAENYHQDFYQKSPARYNQYESLSGRAEYKAKVWEEILKEQI